MTSVLTVTECEGNCSCGRDQMTILLLWSAGPTFIQIYIKVFSLILS